MAVDLQSLVFTITPPTTSSQCVLNYTITTTRSDELTWDIVTEDTRGPLVFSDFNLCAYGYNFTVVGNTRTGRGQRSAVVNLQPTGLFAGKLLFSRYAHVM